MDNLVITVSRECGSAGREIACKLGEKLGLKVYDRHFLNTVAEKFGISSKEMERVKAKKTNWWSEFCHFYQQFDAVASIDTKEQEATPMSLYYAERELLLEVAEKEPFIVVGRSGFNIFRNHPRAFHLLIIADKEARVRRISEKQHLNEEEARNLVERIDKERETFVRTVSNTSRYDAHNYDLVLDVTGLDTEKVAELLAEHVRLKCGDVAD